MQRSAVQLTIDSRGEISLECYRQVVFGGRSMAVGEKANATIALAHRQAVSTSRGERPGSPAVRSVDCSATLPQLPGPLLRGAILARLADCVEGHAAWPPTLVDGMLEFADALHAVDSPEAAATKLEPDELSVVFSSAAMGAAMAADVAIRSISQVALAEQVFALSAVALRAPMAHWDPRLKPLWGDRFTSDAIDSLNELTGGGVETQRPFQAPISWRALPRILGQARRAVAGVVDVADVGLSAVKQDPAFLLSSDARSGTFLSTGSSYDPRSAAAIDRITSTWADLATLCDRQTTKLHRGETSLLPDRLRRGAERANTVRYAIAQVGIGERARNEATRTSIPRSEGGVVDGLADVTSPVVLAWEKEQTVRTHLTTALALLAASASRALYITDRRPTPALESLLAQIRDHAPPDTNRGLAPLTAALERLTDPATSRGISWIDGPHT